MRKYRLKNVVICTDDHVNIHQDDDDVDDDKVIIIKK